MTDPAIALVFAAAGTAAIVQGIRLKKWKPVALGVAVIVAPLILADRAAVIVAGVALVGVLLAPPCRCQRITRPPVPRVRIRDRR